MRKLDRLGRLVAYLPEAVVPLGSNGLTICGRGRRLGPRSRLTGTDVRGTVGCMDGRPAVWSWGRRRSSGRGIVRRAVVVSLEIWAGRQNPVRLLSQAEARADGWPDARVANLSRVLAWARSVDDRQPRAPRPRLLRVDDSSVADEAGAHDIAQNWLGLDPLTHAEMLSLDHDPTDLRTPEALAQAELAWVISEGLQTFQVMTREAVEAVRLKTEGDARLARHPGARASNVALLLAAEFHHARSGYEVVFLPPREGFAEELSEAGRAFGRKHGTKSGIDGEVVADRLLLRDACARDYVHVGRARAPGVAWQMIEEVWRTGT